MLNAREGTRETRAVLQVLDIKGTTEHLALTVNYFRTFRLNSMNHKEVKERTKGMNKLKKTKIILK